MEHIIDLIATDSSAADISDSIKSALFNKAAEKIDLIKPEVASSMFNFGGSEEDYTEDGE